MTTRRRLTALIPVVALLLLAFGGLTRAATASCSAPEIVVTPERIPSGGQVTITGRYWHTSCNDTPQTCSHPSDDPFRSIRLSIRPASGGSATPLGRVDAAEDTFGFDLTVALTQPPGTYTIEARASDPRSDLASATIHVVA